MSALAALIIGWIIFIKRNGLLSIEKLYTTTCIFNNSSDVESFLWVIIIIFFLHRILYAITRTETVYLLN